MCDMLDVGDVLQVQLVGPNAYMDDREDFLINSDGSVSLPDIGKIFSNRDHASVQYACNKINNGLKSDPDLKTMIALIERNLRGWTCIIKDFIGWSP